MFASVFDAFEFDLFVFNLRKLSKNGIQNLVVAYLPVSRLIPIWVHIGDIEFPKLL